VPAAAQAEEGAVAIHPSLMPDRLGASTVFTLAFRFSGGEEGTPPPLHQVVMHLPAGLHIDVSGVKTCQPSSLKRKGPSGCPSGSLVGTGHALLRVHAGSQSLPEQGTMSIFRGPNRGGLQTFEIYGHGNSPLDQSQVSTAILETDKAPFGWKTVTTVPPIPTVMYEPNASFESASVTFGAIHGAPKAHAAAGSIVMPRTCPAGGFPFATEVTFAEGATATASAKVPCP
jgi:hypothetical protein